jgi:hypothetical protein
MSSAVIQESEASRSESPSCLLAAALVRALFCGFRPGEKRMAVFVAFSDESGVGNPDGEFLVSGYIADEERWPSIVTAWQERVLDGPPKIPLFHMNEIRRPEWRAKHKITFNEAEGRISEAIRVLNSVGSMSAIASVIKGRDLREVFHDKFKRKKQVPIGLNEPDYICFLAYASHVLKEVHERYRDVERVNFFAAKKKGVSHHLDSFYELMKKYFRQHRPELFPLFGDLMRGDMEKQLPLQAADTLGWHLQKYYAGTYDQTEGNRIAMLTKDRDGFKHEWKRSELEGIAKRFGLG